MVALWRLHINFRGITNCQETDASNSPVYKLHASYSFGQKDESINPLTVRWWSSNNKKKIFKVNIQINCLGTLKLCRFLWNLLLTMAICMKNFYAVVYSIPLAGSLVAIFVFCEIISVCNLFIHQFGAAMNPHYHGKQSGWKLRVTTPTNSFVTGNLKWDTTGNVLIPCKFVST